MKRKIVRRVGLGIGALLLVIGASACDGNTYSPDNCSLVLAGAISEGIVPDVGWQLIDAYRYHLYQSTEVYYYCRAVTLAYGGSYLRFNITDRDAVVGGDGSYDIPLGPLYESNRYDLPGTAQMCKGQFVPSYFGWSCSDHGL